MSRVFEISDQYVNELAELDPVAATSLGVPGHDHRLSDYSPAGLEAGDALNARYLALLAEAPEENERDRVAAGVMRSQLELQREFAASGEDFRDLNILSSPLQSMRRIFDLMPRDTDEQWENIARRMAAVPGGLASYRETLEEGIRLGTTAARRQVVECAKQARTWSGAGGGTSYFAGLAAEYDGGGGLRAQLDEAAIAATEAYAEMAGYLETHYFEAGANRDAYGADRYALHSRMWNGVDLDLQETYLWGWEEVQRIEREMLATAERILPGKGVEAAKTLLESDPARVIEGEEPFRQWMQDLQDRTIAELNGTHFDIPEPVQRIEALIAPPGGALAMYYTSPSEDFSRPGRTWYPTGGKTRFPLWGEVSIAYHEGVPGHHLERAGSRYLGDRLSRFQKLMGGTSGYVEGWGLYAERLMGELGYLDNPDYYLGMLRAQALRCVRVVIDIGMHLELAIPGGQPFHPGERWTPELGLEFAKLHSHFPPEFMESELTRYLGRPGQAISYKVGEREWLAAREAAKARLGPDFDLRRFHREALDLGPVGLDLLKTEMAGSTSN